ncbi:MAG: hypothetical protein R3E96_07445 [Planctomycetota bacterium]
MDNPARYGMTGIPALFRPCIAKGANKQEPDRLRRREGAACSAMAAKTRESESETPPHILRKLLWKNGIQLSAEDTGGTTLAP